MHGQQNIKKIYIKNHKISCVITAGYIWLHVSAVTRPSSGQQGLVFLRYIQLDFPMASHCLHYKF